MLQNCLTKITYIFGLLVHFPILYLFECIQGLCYKPLACDVVCAMRDVSSPELNMCDVCVITCHTMSQFLLVTIKIGKTFGKFSKSNYT